MDVRGIDKIGIDKQVISLGFYKDEIQSNLNDITTSMEKLTTAYKGNGSDMFLKKYAELSEKYQQLYAKLESYCTDLLVTVEQYEKFDQSLQTDLNNASTQVDGR